LSNGESEPGSELPGYSQISRRERRDADPNWPNSEARKRLCALLVAPFPESVLRRQLLELAPWALVLLLDFEL
jgi:hypothetical protein